MSTTNSHRNLYLAASVACMTAALFGYSVGFIGGIIVLPSFLEHFGLDSLSPGNLASATSGTVTTWLVGALLGVPLGMPVCSRLGKRPCLTLCAVLYTLGAVLQLLDKQSLLLFDVGRFTNGLGVGAGTLVSPMYIAEIATPETRGMLLSGYQTVLQIGALIGFWAAFAAHAYLEDSSSLQWQIPVSVQLIPGICLLVGTLLLPESPCQLAAQGNIDAARSALHWLRRSPAHGEELEREFRAIQRVGLATATLQERRPSFWSVMNEKSLRKRLAVGVGLMVAQNMVGLNALNYYAPKVFMSAGFTSVSSSLFLTGLFGLVKVVSALSFMFTFVGMKGNRFWLKSGSAICGAAMVSLALVRNSTDPGMSHDNPNVYGWVATSMVYVFAFAFGISLGPISWNVCSEIFPAHIKAQCCAITTCTQWLFQIVIAGITPHLLESFGWGMYLIYAIFCAVTLVWVSLFVPETQGVALGSDMDRLFGFEPKDSQQSAIEADVDETTALLYRNNPIRARRDSVGHV
ncbi:general substrate transporter [Myriangium duriaei CBS 260.36]|uniref:General substrate transporter n=1 Tax=Myriangium duriaei CBS 260.36 TaxID=1168546 RepID=A0A9P4MQF3_9PEZI|nr:general substrate transporter [Myriangium duriaei CBS 260.36]